MPEVNYANLPRLLTTTLPKFLGRPGDSRSLINEAAPKNILWGRLLKKARLDAKGGLTLKFPVQFQRAQIVQASGPFTKAVMKQTPAPSHGEVPRRFMQWLWYMPYVEIDTNEGDEFATVLDLSRRSRADVVTDLVTFLEENGLARSGNYAHDGIGSNDALLFFGLFYWCTIDGLHITGDATKTVGGFNPATEDKWRNGFINPVTAIDNRGPIKSIFDLRRALDRAMRFMRWDDLDLWGAPAKGHDAIAYDPDGQTRPEDLMIWMDDGSSIDFREALLAREDNVGRDQGRGRPMHRGIEIFDSDRMGIPATGYGYDAAGNPLWTDRGGSYASGQWGGYGETVLINTKFFHFVLHPKHFPYVKKAYEPEGMMGIAHEGDLWFNSCCRSRQRGVFYIGPYPLSQTA